MIVFEGALSDSAKKYHTKNALLNLLVFSVFLIALIIPFCHFMFLFISSFVRTDSFLFKMFAAIPVFAVIAAVVCVFKINTGAAPKKVTLTDETVTSFTSKTPITKYTHEVTEVLDLGEFYHLKFKERSFNSYFICQKSLLKEGSLEEFKNLFQGKIINKQHI